LFFSNPVENDLNSFINTSRSQRVQSTTSYYSPQISYYQPEMFDTQSEIQFNRAPPTRSFSPDDLQKMKYKIDLGKRFSFRLIKLQ
jgi:hypothetical protein